VAFGAALSTEFDAALSQSAATSFEVHNLACCCNHRAMPTTSTCSTHVTMTQKIRIELCRLKISEPGLTHAYLRKWLKQTHNLSISQSCISKTLKRSFEILGPNTQSNMSGKRVKSVKYPLMEDALIEWFRTYQDQVNMNGDLVKEKGAIFLNRIYPDHDPFEFSNGWLESFKNRYGIRSFRRFGESGSVNMARVTDELPKLIAVLNRYEWNDIYNMDETGLFYRMHVGTEVIFITLLLSNAS
jgi:hypothetical protein